MSVDPIRVSPEWLDLREGADAAARSRALVARLGDGPWLIHDLAAGSGSMGRWLAPLLPGRQHWILHDRDPDLLALAASAVPLAREVTVETRVSDVTQLDAKDLAGATLVTASALLDLLTEGELASIVGTCVAVGCPVLFALSVTGSVDIAPSDPLDERFAAAFDAHQRRRTPRGRLLGPDAVDAVIEAFGKRGIAVAVAMTPWLLGAADAALTEEWLTGWIDAACEQDPTLAADADLYRRRRLGDARTGRLSVTVGHADLLVH